MYEDQYKEHRIPKRNGGFRIIHEPAPELKAKQRSILNWLQARGIKPSYYAYGFIRGRSTVKHARLHVGKKIVLKLDIEDFFGNTKSSMIKVALRKEKLPDGYINEIIETCTYKNSLPQGSPASPFLSNIVLTDMDSRLAGLAMKYKATYSRYADDMCFSSNDPALNKMLKAIEYVVNQCGYKLNSRKTKVLRRNSRQIITGVVVNEKANIPRSLLRTTRARLHNLKMSIFKKLAFDEEELEKLRGMVSYFSVIRADIGIRFKKDLKEIEHLLKFRQQAQT